MRQRAIVVVSILGLVVLVAWAWDWWASRRADAHTCRLADGSTIQLVNWTYDKPITIRVGNRWRDALVPFLTKELLRKLDCNYASAGGTNLLVFCLRHDGIVAGNAPRLRASTFDEHGCEFRVTGVSDARYRTPKQALWLISFDEFPRRGKTLGLRLYQAHTNGGFSKLAEFTVPNPDQRKFPVWQPEPLPITRTLSNLALTLVDVKGGVYGRSHPPQLPKPGEDCGFLLKFRVTEDGKPTSTWSLAGIKGLVDPMGQTSGQGSYAGGGAGHGEITAVVAGGLCTEEPALRLSMDLARERDFSATDLWTIRGVPLPDERSFTPFGAETNLHGVSLQLQGIYGQQCPGPNPRRSMSSSPVIYVTAANLLDHLDFKLVKVLDDRGRSAYGGGRASSFTNYVFSLKSATDAKSVDVTFAVTKRVAFEFLAKPSRMTAEEIAKLRKKLGYQ